MKKFADGMYKIKGEGALRVLEKTLELEKAGKRILHFEIGQPDFPTPTHIKNAAKQAIDDNYTGYVNSSGIIELKEAIQVEIEQTRGFIPSLDQILILPGVKPGLYLTIISTCTPGDDIMFPSPGFPTYDSLSDYIGLNPIPIPLKESNNFRLNPSDVEEKITPNTKLIILNSPNNPTGSVMTKEENQEIASITEESDVFVLTDETYSKIIYDKKFHSVTSFNNATERTILVDGFSKAYSMTGWRLGYLIGPKKLVQKLSLLVINSLTCTVPFIQRAGIAALSGSQNALNRMLGEFKKRRDVLVSGLNKIPGFSCQVPDGAFYAWPNVKKTGKTSQEVADDLLYNEGIACLPGTDFGTNGEGYLRFSYATSIDVIEEALSKIKQFFS